MLFPNKLFKKLLQRKEKDALRNLKEKDSLVDFSSNDYLGFAKSTLIFNKTHQFLIDNNIQQNGATGSRLLSGNYNLYKHIEKQLLQFHNAEESLIFNSGYDANIGFFSSVPQRGDIILYDELIHASIRDGIQLSNAKSFKFKHNNLQDLEKRIVSIITELKTNNLEIYVVTESVFSMDGDSPDLIAMSALTKKYNAFFIVDEAHAVGVFGGGLIQKYNLEKEVFARIVTFGKALGCHGAVILGSKSLKQYLVNFARSFIYTTGLPPHSLVTIKYAYQELSKNTSNKKLEENIQFFKQEIKRLNLNFIASNSPIQCIIISESKKVKQAASLLKEKGFDVKPILSPTVAKNKERLRFCIHTYNSKKEITTILEELLIFALL